MFKFYRDTLSSYVMSAVMHLCFDFCLFFSSHHQAAVMVMEDSEAFNAGRGSKLTVSLIKWDLFSQILSSFLNFKFFLFFNW